MINLTLTVLASIVLAIGLVSMVTPIPGGTIIIAASLTTLICTSPRARMIIQYLRKKNNFINKLFYVLEDKVGSRVIIIGKTLKKTQPANVE